MNMFKSKYDYIHMYVQTYIMAHSQMFISFSGERRMHSELAKTAGLNDFLFRVGDFSV